MVLSATFIMCLVTVCLFRVFHPPYNHSYKRNPLLLHCSFCLFVDTDFTGLESVVKMGCTADMIFKSNSFVIVFLRELDKLIFNHYFPFFDCFLQTNFFQVKPIESCVNQVEIGNSKIICIMVTYAHVYVYNMAF